MAFTVFIVIYTIKLFVFLLCYISYGDANISPPLLAASALPASARISVILVTSPCADNPSTSMVETVVESLSLIGLEDAPLTIVADGFKTRSVFKDSNLWSMAKRGVIAEENAAAYEEYLDRLESKGFHLMRLPHHNGFAMAVKKGLEACSTTFCLILQHDRCFCRPVPDLHFILDSFEKDESIRYVGFNTFKSSRHDEVLEEKYGLLETFQQLSLPIDTHNRKYSLLPLLFWYDSNHIAHVERYLQIYAPFTFAPPEVRAAFGPQGIKSMLLREGDFIEDRYSLSSCEVSTSAAEINSFCPEGLVRHSERYSWLFTANRRISLYVP